MINWPSFFYTPFALFPNQMTFYAMSSFIAVGNSFSNLEKPQHQNLPQSCEIENQDKLQLTEEDLRNQTYQSNKKAWTEQEDKKLVYLYEKKKLSWEEIAKRIPQRNKKMCYSRYRRLESGTKILWAKKDNEELISLVNQYGENWKKISEHFRNRNPKQIKEHYKNYARPDIDKSEWSLEDDIKLIKLINEHGKNWKLIESEMCHRSLNQIKNRFFGKLKKLNSLLYGQIEQNGHLPTKY